MARIYGGPEDDAAQLVCICGHACYICSRYVAITMFDAEYYKHKASTNTGSYASPRRPDRNQVRLTSSNKVTPSFHLSTQPLFTVHCPVAVRLL